MKTAATLNALYDAMLASLGPSHWWPGDTPFEVAVGAVLTQNTNWKNVEKAIANIKAADCLEPHKLYDLDVETLAELIRPAGYYNIKAKRLRNLLAFLEDEADLKMENLLSQSLQELRPKLIAVNGIGPETADSILLYALGYPTFVVDAYTFRIMQRHGLAWEGMDYHELQALFMDVLPPDVALYNEYHALIVRIGNSWCKKKAGLCESCPLQPLL